MKTHNLSAALLAFGLLVAAPAFAQTTPSQKQQPTQEGGTSFAPTPSGGAYNANPNYKQPTQEGGTSFAPTPSGGAYNANPSYKQPTQEGGGGRLPCGTPYNANPAGDPNCKQRTQNLTPTSGQGTAEAAGKHK